MFINTWLIRSAYKEAIMSITVYTKTRCPQCEATKRQLTKQGLNFNQVDLSDCQELIDQFIAQGFKQTPIVVTDEATWTGYRPDLIKKIAAQTKVTV